MISAIAVVTCNRAAMMVLVHNREGGGDLKTVPGGFVRDSG